MEPLLVDYVTLNPLDNALLHNTVKFEAVNEENPTTTIVRRGQPFSGVVRFTRPFDEANDVIQLVFSIGDRPSMDTVGKTFILRRHRDVSKNKRSWRANLEDVSHDNSTVSFKVSTPVNAPVGAWVLRVVTWQRGSVERAYYDFDQDIYILFNPWNPDDQTYMEDTALLQEYVLNDVGKVWMGPVRMTRGKPWDYGQFDKIVLPACMFMLDRDGIPYQHRGDPVKMARAISRIVNANDDGGVLSGRWDGDYDNGTAPFDWTGSVDILDQFLKSKRSVRYGQCWVFACVVNTVCRALGIPSRVVSNVVSAHDANCNLSIDKYYSETMEELRYDPTNKQPGHLDSIWNYHVWNDVYMARPDLTKGFGGWQAIDATPQEKSNGSYQCGPAPLEAIKQGVIGMNYDVEFMLASVNADLMRWRIDPSEETGYAIVDSDKYCIGRMVLTKKSYVFDPNGDEDCEDITEQYKFREGTASERLALMNGVRFSERAKRYYSLASKRQNDVTFKLRDIDTVPIGRDFRVTVDIENTSGEGRNINVSLSAISIFYNGVRADVIKKVEEKIFVEPGHKNQSILVRSDDYLPKLVEYYNIKISAMAIVDETKQAWADEDDFQFVKPNITIKFNEDLILNEPTVALLSFTNPLDRVLTDAEFRVTSSGIAGRTLKLKVPDVGPQEHIKSQLPILPIRPGKISIVATFKSTELKDIRGAATDEVYYKVYPTLLRKQ